MIIKVKDHYRIDFFNELTFTLRYNSVASSYSFKMYFDPKNENHVELLKPGHYHVMSIEHNGELLMTGSILNQTFSHKSIKQLSSVSGYSLPGVLEDCTIPPNLYPLQSDGQTLREIAQKLIGFFPFGMKIDPLVASRMNEVYIKTTASESESIKSYLSSLAAQKNIILSHTPEGDLLFTQAKTDQKPFFHFEGGMSNIEMDLSFNGQGMHRDITVMKQADKDGGNAGQTTTRNPFVPFTRRPNVKIQNSGNDIDTVKAAQNALGTELKNIVLTIKTNFWEINGKTLIPNTTLTARSDELFMFGKVKWFVESVTFSGNEKQNTAVMKCVLPEVYNGNIPKYFFK